MSGISVASYQNRDQHIIDFGVTSQTNYQFQGCFSIINLTEDLPLLYSIRTSRNLLLLPEQSTRRKMGTLDPKGFPTCMFLDTKPHPLPRIFLFYSFCVARCVINFVLTCPHFGLFQESITVINQHEHDAAFEDATDRVSTNVVHRIWVRAFVDDQSVSTDLPALDISPSLLGDSPHIFNPCPTLNFDVSLSSFVVGHFLIVFPLLAL